MPPDTFAAEAFPYLHKDGEYAKRLSQPTDLVRNIKQVKRDELRDEYLKLIEYAPHRADRGKCYLVDGHTGIPSGTSDSNRFEDHLAMALWKLKRFWPRADGGQFYLLDYQFPLQARQSDRGIGKVDLVGLTKKRRFMVIELKVKPKGENNRGKTPVAALLQGLRYAAIVQANQEVIAKEVESRFKITVAEQPPIVQVLAARGLVGRLDTIRRQHAHRHWIWRARQRYRRTDRRNYRVRGAQGRTAATFLRRR